MPVTTSDAKIYQSGFSGLTHTNIASFLKRTLTASEQTLVTQLIKDKEIALCVYTNRQFGYGSNFEYYETINGGFTRFVPYATPVATLEEIIVDGVDVTANYTVNEDYFIYDNSIIFETPIVSASNNRRAVKLTYTVRQFWADDIKNLLTKWVALEFLSSEDGGVNTNNVTFGNLSKGLNLDMFEKEKMSIIYRYTDFVV